jgi:tetratricopeptide (TPR) repeat protein
MRRLLAFASLSLLTASAFAMEPPREKERWTTLAIDELTVYSSADDYTTRSVASDLVRLRGALGVVTKLKVRSPVTTRVFIFGDRRSFEQYCQAAIGRSDNLTGVFQAAFHTSYDELERELRKYIRAFTMSYIRYTLADLKAVEIPTPQPLPREVELVALADLLMHTNTPHFVEAEAFLNAALKTNSSSASAYAELAAAKSWQRQNGESEANFEKAVQLGSRDAQPYIRYGQSILRRVDTSVRHNAGAPSADVLKARELFRKATELNPSSAPAFSGLGATCCPPQKIFAQR